jgi:transcriptional regulator with XRE-family HTH domain
MSKNLTDTPVEEIRRAKTLLNAARWGLTVANLVADNPVVIIDSMCNRFGLQLKELAELAGISIPWISRVRNGHHGARMSLETAAKLAAVWDELLEKEESDV